MLIYIAERIKIKTDNNSCRICLQETHHNDCMILRCKHFFHEDCLWDWLYIKNQCPICCEPLNNDK